PASLPNGQESRRSLEPPADRPPTLNESARRLQAAVRTCVRDESGASLCSVSPRGRDGEPAARRSSRARANPDRPARRARPDATPERYERAAARWIARLDSERPPVRLSEVELAAGAFREAVFSDRGEKRLRDRVP